MNRKKLGDEERFVSEYVILLLAAALFGCLKQKTTTTTKNPTNVSNHGIDFQTVIIMKPNFINSSTS